MTEDKPGDEFNSANAELYDTLAHPSRILILKALSDHPAGFAELKRTTGIESSGNLSFHLNKLGRLVRTDSEGKYCLTDEGKEAIRVIDATERLNPEAQPQRQRQRGPKVGAKSVGVLLTLAVVLAVVMMVSGSLLATQTQVIPQGSTTSPVNFTLQPGASKVLFGQGGGGAGLYGVWQIVYVGVTSSQTGQFPPAAEFQVVATGDYSGAQLIFSTQSEYASSEFSVPAGTHLVNFSVSNSTDAPLTVVSVYTDLSVIVQPDHSLGETLLYLGAGFAVVSIAAFGSWFLLQRYRTPNASGLKELQPKVGQDARPDAP